MGNRTVAGYLAQSGWLSQQGEVLCTQGLTFLLSDEGLRAAFGRYLSDRTGVAVGGDVVWLAEARQADNGRPDLEARRREKTPVAKIEAKLGAVVDPSQLESYARDLENRNGGESVLAVLVPHNRLGEAESVARGAFLADGSGPCWRPVGRRIAVTVLSWEYVFEVLGSAAEGPVRCDVDQLHGMYLVLAGLDFVPLASIGDLNDWDAQAAEAIKLIDLTTRSLGGPWKLLPIGTEQIPEGDQLVEYRRRYVCMSQRVDTPCYSIGVRRPFVTYTTPIWLRFHSNTPGFPDIRSNLLASTDYGPNVVESGGHVWLPLDPSLGVTGLVERARAIGEVADPRWTHPETP